MDSFIDGGNKEKGPNKLFLVATVLAVLAVVAIGVGVSMIPSPEQEKEAVLEDAHRAGSKEFDDYNNQIIISNDPNQLFEKYTGMGDIIMGIGGTIRNRGEKTLIGLEVSVGMVDSKGKLIKDKKVLVVPRYQSELKPKEKINFSVNIPGFEKDDDRANARWKVTAVKFKVD